MSQVIIYINDANRVSVVYPAPEAIELYGLEAIARKDVPEGKSFKYMDESDVPHPSEWDSWQVDPSTLTDGVGGNFTSFE